jgi:cytochrome c oxidase subunit 2
MVSLVRWFKVLFALPFLLGLTACFEKLPMTTVHVVTDWGHDINRVYLITTIITSIVFVAVAVPFCYALWRFREKPGDNRFPEQIKGNHKLEILWTLIPVVLLIFIFLPSLEVIMKRSEAPPKESLVIEAIGHQWWWEFRYPDLNIVTANEMVVPEDTPILVKLKSADVIHLHDPKAGES